MAKKTFRIRANFPVQAVDITQEVEAGGWPAAMGKAVRLIKKQLRGKRVAAASFTIEQLTTIKATVASLEQASFALDVDAAGGPVVPEPGSEG